jgi:hypothetical protein
MPITSIRNEGEPGLKRLLGVLVSLTVLSAPVIGQPLAVSQPAVSVHASAATTTGEPRSFRTSYGDITWVPSLPLYTGDRLTLAFEPSAKMQPYRVSLTLDERPLASIGKSPWQTVIDTSGLTPGRHVVNGDIRYTGTPRKYSKVEFAFFVQQPVTEVKGVVETYGDSSIAAIRDKSPAPAGFVAPTGEQIDQSFGVTLVATDSEATSAIAARQPVRVGQDPIELRLTPAVGLDRWAYSMTRDGRQLSAAGSINPTLGVEVASKSPTGHGLLPGVVTITAWGIKSNGVYSRPVVAQLVIQ